MPKQTDGDYAETMMQLLKQDILKLDSAPAAGAWSSIVIWEAEELRRQAQSLDVPGQTAVLMRTIATEAITKAQRIRAEAAA
jgi:hypothetical protein